MILLLGVLNLLQSDVSVTTNIHLVNTYIDITTVILVDPVLSNLYQMYMYIFCTVTLFA